MILVQCRVIVNKNIARCKGDARQELFFRSSEMGRWKLSCISCLPPKIHICQVSCRVIFHLHLHEPAHQGAAQHVPVSPSQCSWHQAPQGRRIDAALCSPGNHLLSPGSFIAKGAYYARPNQAAAWYLPAFNKNNTESPFKIQEHNHVQTPANL